MYSASGSFQNAIWQPVRDFKRRVTVNLANETTLILQEEELIEFTIRDAVVSGEKIEVGSAVSKELNITLNNIPGDYDLVLFGGAEIYVEINLNDIEWIPMGTFYVDEAPRPGKLIQIVAFDVMIKFDRWFTSPATPTSPLLLLSAACTQCGVTLHTTSFTNSNISVPTVPDKLTCRQVVQYVAQLSGNFALINRNSHLVLKWYTPANDPINKFNVFRLRLEEAVTVTGVEYTHSDEDVTYLVGTEGYVVVLEENPFIQTDVEAVVTALASGIVGTSFTPGTIEHQGNPCWDAGDLITVTDDKDVEHTVSTGENMFNMNGFKCTTKSAAESVDRAGYVVAGLSTKRMNDIRRIVAREILPEITAREQAIANATSLFMTMLGGNVLKRENEILIMDDPDPEQAVKVWRWSMAGIGYSDNVVGVDNPERIYTTALTMDGALVAQWINAALINADLIQVGTLDADRIGANTITANHINTTGLVADEALLAHVYAGEIHADQITAGIIAAERIATDIAQVNRLINIGHPELFELRRINFMETTTYNGYIHFDPGEEIEPGHYIGTELKVYSGHDVRIHAGVDFLVNAMMALLPSQTFLGGTDPGNQVATVNMLEGGGGGTLRKLVDLQFYPDGMITTYDNGDIVYWGFTINEQGYISHLNNSENREINVAWFEDEYLME